MQIAPEYFSKHNLMLQLFNYSKTHSHKISLFCNPKIKLKTINKKLGPWSWDNQAGYFPAMHLGERKPPTERIDVLGGALMTC